MIVWVLILALSVGLGKSLMNSKRLRGGWGVLASLIFSRTRPRAMCILCVPSPCNWARHPNAWRKPFFSKNPRNQKNGPQKITRENINEKITFKGVFREVKRRKNVKFFLCRRLPELRARHDPSSYRHDLIFFPYEIILEKFFVDFLNRIKWLTSD